MRSITRVYEAAYHPIADLITYSPLPNAQISQIDPFLFLNHHGYQVYTPNNSGLPFGPHPHRGMQTLTFIIKGDIMHKDSVGYQSTIEAGGVQWMVAGSGLLHAEVSSPKFKKEGGELEILQLWINLPKKLKMTTPHYQGLQKDDIPSITVNENVHLNLIFGNYQQHKAPLESLTPLFMSTLEFKEKGKWQIDVPVTDNVFCYLIKGSTKINGQTIQARNLVDFANDNERISIEAETDALLIFGYATPFDEPVVAQGPFVMNTKVEIFEALRDYQNGKFGVWKD